MIIVIYNRTPHDRLPPELVEPAIRRLGGYPKKRDPQFSITSPVGMSEECALVRLLSAVGQQDHPTVGTHRATCGTCHEICQLESLYQAVPA